MHACDSVLKRWFQKGQAIRLHHEFSVILAYMRPCVKEKKRILTKMILGSDTSWKRTGDKEGQRISELVLHPRNLYMGLDWENMEESWQP